MIGQNPEEMRFDRKGFIEELLVEVLLDVMDENYSLALNNS